VVVVSGPAVVVLSATVVVGAAVVEGAVVAGAVVELDGLVVEVVGGVAVSPSSSPQAVPASSRTDAIARPRRPRVAPHCEMGIQAPAASLHSIHSDSSGSHWM